MRILIRGATEIEIILQPTAVEPAPVEAAERAPAKTSAAGSSAANPCSDSPGVAIGADNPGGSHVDHQDGQPSESLTDTSPAAGEKAVPSAGGGDESRRLTEEPEEARTAPPATVPDVAATLAKVGDQVRAAVANPPPPVVDPAPELPMRRPVEEDDLAFPDFLDRRRTGGGSEAGA